MKYLKKYSFFESIIKPTFNKDALNFYLEKLGISLEDLNDIFIGMLQSNYKSYLDLFYLDKNGSRYSEIPGSWSKDSDRENHPLIPYLSITFERTSEIESTIKNTSRHSLKVTYSNNIELLESFVDSVHRLKSMFPKQEIYWKYSEANSEICIYFDAITDKEDI